MNITSISAGTSTFSPVSNNNNEIRMLEKQKERLQDQIKTVKESNSDAKIKQELIKQLQEEIQKIEIQIQQKRNEKLTEGARKNFNDKKSNNQPKSSSVGNSELSEMNDLIEASSSYSKVRIMTSTKESLNGNSNILKQEIKLDAGRGIDPIFKKKELSETATKVQSLNDHIGEELHVVRKQVDEAAEYEKADSQEKPEAMEDRADKDALHNEELQVSDAVVHVKTEQDSMEWAKINNIKYNGIDIQI